ncbi:GNAT family N-acetyltransferase [Paenibacillus vulneris]|uniref:GNAT family N-acetyltransferase n=1 Tax=Paenibacillus vulneris TaxID=1133364 RepID=A0ABW3UTL5_9BACL
MYAFRSLNEGDLETICQFPQSEEELLYMSPRSQYPLIPEKIVQLLQNRYEPSVVMDVKTQEVAGYANLYDLDPAECSCWVGNVIISPEYRGKGAAEFLFDHLLQKAKDSLKVQKAFLWCHNTNTRGLSFYHKYGFKPVDMKIMMLGANRVVSIQMYKPL